jgi:phage terminase large subunit-like protein
VYKIVHAKNANSQEGLNGSIFIDETHVIGNDIVDVIKRAGISRREPLHVEMSTAGDISNDYGKSRFDYGISNSAIEFPEAWNPNFLCINFSVSQQLPASTFQSEREVLKLAVKANPGFGRLFTKENILSDFRTSRQSPPELAQFKRYRLGIWLSGGVNWLDYNKWQACAHPYPPEISRLKKYPLAMGVDLSHTRDTTSVVLEFGLTDPDNPGNLIPYFVPYFWIPRSSVDRYRKFFNFEKWSKHVTIVEEEAIQTEAIADFVHEIYTDGYDVRGLGFDPHHSSIFINRLLKVHGWSENMLREIPTTIRYMSGPTKDLENMIINQQMYHSNHPVMNWQIGHVQVICDQTDHYMPAKPGKFRAKGGGTDDPRKIDGVIAAVNANAVSTDNEIGFRNNSGLVLI